MLKINLLPPYVQERRKVRKMAFLFGVIFVALLAGMISWSVALNGKEKQLKADVADMEMRANAVIALQSEVSAEEAKIPPIEAKVGFIESILKYNEEVPKLYEELARYTYSRILYLSVQPANNQLTIQAHARSVGDCGRYLLNMYRARHIFSSVTISSVPGWPAGSGGGIGAPVSMAGAPPVPGAPAGAAPGMPGMPPGAAGPMGLPGAPGMPQTSRPSQGFDFTVTCSLVRPIASPAYTPGGAAGGAAAGDLGAGVIGGMPPGAPGAAPGMPGMPPGAAPGSPGAAPAGMPSPGAPPR